MLCLEQFLQSTPEFLWVWLLDRSERGSLENTARLADDFLGREDADRDEDQDADYFMNLAVQRERETD